MVVPLAVAGGLAAGGAFASYLGHKESMKGIEADEKAYAEYLARIAGISVPQAEKLILEDPKLMGKLSDNLPLEEAVQTGPSAMAGISSDPRFQQAQIDALTKLQEVGAEGMTAQDKFALEQIQQRQGRDAAARNQNILQNMAMRGVGGSGQELAAKLSSEQAGADTAAMQGLGVQAEKQRRALEAMQQAGSLAGNIRGQGFNEQSAIAQAKDAAARFNASMRAGAHQRNIGAKRQAAAQDLQTAQALEQQRVQTRAMEQEAARADVRNEFDMEMQKAGMMKPGAFGSQKGASEQKMYGGIAGALGSLGAGVAGSAAAAPAAAPVAPVAPVVAGPEENLWGGYGDDLYGPRRR